MQLESIIAIAREGAMSATSIDGIVEQAGQYASDLWNNHRHSEASTQDVRIWARSVGKDFAVTALANAEALIIGITRAAKNGAKSIAPERADLIQEAGQHAAAIWHERSLRKDGRGVDNPEDWAFIVGKNYVRKSLTKQAADRARFTDLNDTKLIRSGALCCVDPNIERISSSCTFHQITAPEAVEAIRRLASVTIDTINRNSDHIDIRIFHFHYGRHFTFAMIARETGITEDVAKKRWWRMINRTVADVREIIGADPILARVFEAILTDDDDNVFRTALIQLMGTIAERGLSAIEDAAHQMFPPA
jgi:hypothetical protein